jgi:hypothetical protein
LTEAVARQHREDEAKKMEDAMQKKEASEAKKMATPKKANSLEEVAIRKRKREEAKIAKELEKASKPKRAYRRRLLAPSISEQESSISVGTSTISEVLNLPMEETQARSPAPSWGGYVYGLMEFWSVLGGESGLRNKGYRKFHMTDYFVPRW